MYPCPMILQTVAAVAAIVLTFLAFESDPPPVIVYVGVAGFAAWGATWLVARLKYGRGVIVTPSRPK